MSNDKECKPDQHEWKEIESMIEEGYHWVNAKCLKCNRKQVFAAVEFQEDFEQKCLSNKETK